MRVGVHRPHRPEAKRCGEEVFDFQHEVRVARPIGRQRSVQGPSAPDLVFAEDAGEDELAGQAGGAWPATGVRPTSKQRARRTRRRRREEEVRVFMERKGFIVNRQVEHQ